MDCVFCREDGGELLWKDERLRVVLASGETDYPGFCRVIWQAHVAEFTDLAPADRSHLMLVVAAVERAVRRVMQPDKVNLASLGNQVPHVHWHVIPRFSNDAHFPHRSGRRASARCPSRCCGCARRRRACCTMRCTRKSN